MSTTDSPPPPPPPPAGPPPAGPSGPRISSHEARDLGGLRRTVKASPEGRHVAGVAGGLARHFDIDPVIVRVLLVILVFFGGAGLLLYGACWVLVPEEGDDRAMIQLDDRNRSLALYVAGGLAALAVLGDTVGRFDFPWPLAVIALIVLVLVSKRDQLRAGRRPAGPVAPPAYGPVNGPGHGPAYGPAAPGAPTDGAADPPVAAAPYGSSAQAPGTATWEAPPTYVAPTYPTYVPQPNPRRRGPILFWFTLALIALSLGTLGIIDAAGASVADSAYPAVAVGITGAMLVLGAFWGRAGGLILVGLLATVGLIGATASQEFDNDDHRIHAAPTSAAAVHDDYDVHTGELVLDLTGISDPAALDGRTITVTGGIGKLSVVVPDDWAVHADTDVGVGSSRVLDSGEDGGIGISRSGGQSGAVGAPEVRFDVHLGVGAIQVMRESDFPWPDDDFSGWSTR
ncbi:phage shock protein C (PspC) family protein [Nocardioides terrae]|uniref:Phage shock protein C (PspC) family protein n=1 Tax=Nocardioides terrae TaxID=574651 RepID=A0A1I1LU46_9ACTN|nr:PspC domain-containing protein [Nocardioides terrae]SFC72990.1 phage shock protein C (PspC) family protein [Nocardioides terrae]